MRHKVTLIPGEGIGPEVAAATRRILEAAGVQIDWEEIEGRTDKTTERGQLVNQLAVESVRKNHVALKGPMATAIAGGAPSVNVALRKTLDLYANLRPVRALPNVPSRNPGLDLVVVRFGVLDGKDDDGDRSSMPAAKVRHPPAPQSLRSRGPCDRTR